MPTACPQRSRGTLFNSIVLAVVTTMTEARMLRQPERVDAFRAYQASTSALVLWFKGR